MKKKLTLSAAYLLMGCIAIYSQKKAIDVDAGEHWDKLVNYKISNNGKFVYYQHGSADEFKTVLVSADNSYRKEFLGISNVSFTDDSNWLVFNTNQGIGFFSLASKKIDSIISATNFKVVTNKIFYKKNDTIFIKELRTGSEKRFADAVDILIDKNKRSAIIIYNSKLLWLDLLQDKVNFIIDRVQFIGGNFDALGMQYVFLAKDGNRTNLYHYRSKGQRVEKLITKTDAIPLGYTVCESIPPKFSNDGNRIYFSLTRRIVDAPKDPDLITPNPEIWSYRDKNLRLEFLKIGQNSSRTFIATLSLKNGGRIFQLENDSNKLTGLNGPGNNFALVEDITSADRSYYDSSQVPTCKLVNLEDGHILLAIKLLFRDISFISFSEQEKFLYWYSSSQERIFIYDLLLRKLNNFLLPVKFYRSQFVARVVKWLDNDKSFLLQSDNDLWQFDPKGIMNPINLTHGYGALHNISFVLADPEEYNDGTLLLAGFNNNTKSNGFFRVQPGVSRNPIVCNGMQNAHFYFPAFAGHLPTPVKAKYSDEYLVQCMTSSSAPDLLITKDFKSFIQLSDIHPERNYNWLTSELHSWKTTIGDSIKGILYKPEDFDSNKKYPIIFTYYQLRSNELHLFLSPDVRTTPFDIPFYVSNGYLVFVPDVDPLKRQGGKNAEYITDVAVSAANYLKNNFSFVDEQRMGLTGHSFGGYETNIIVTHTNIFAAAQPSAGQTDLIVGYNTGFGPPIHEVGQVDLQSTPWGKGLDNYIKNSPLFECDKIQTPLLIQCGKNDLNVVPLHSIALFVSLRRQNKPVWLIQYANNGHTLSEVDALDFAIRQKQFFDYYLKSKHAPLWMVESTNAEEQSTKSYLQTDTLNRKP